jgi:WD40 repeat protein/serine/threonine protein kinase
MIPCPADEELSGFLADSLGAAERDALARHVDLCATCQEKLASWTVTPDGDTWRRAEHPLRGSETEEDVVRRLKRLCQPPESVNDEQGASLAGRPNYGSEPLPTVPGYEILEELGRGGMGIVYKARQLALQRIVALKMILAAAHASAKDLVRFRAEAEVIARLQHPNIVQVFEVGEAFGRSYFALEFVSGGSLAQHLGGRPQRARVAAQLVEAVARAVHAAHVSGVVHRDLKPANILLVPEDRGSAIDHEFAETAEPPSVERDLLDAIPKITDFGLARRSDGDGNAPALPGPTVTGEFLGTPHYMAPEQAMVPRQPVGPVADVYALGAILYELLTGRPPFTGETPLDTVLQVLHNEPVSITRLQPNAPGDLETICLKCLRKEPHKRYDTAAALADDLKRYLDGRAIEARRVSAWERSWKWARRQPARAAVVMLLAVLFGVGLPGATALWLQADRARLNEKDARTDEGRQRGAAEQALYLSQVALTRQYLEANQFAQAVEQHAACKPDLRNWEWYYLDRLCHSSLLYSVPQPVPEDEREFYVERVAFSPDGRQLLSASGLPYALTNRPWDAPLKTPGRVKLWNAQTGKPEESLNGHGGATWTAAFSPDGKVAWGSADGGVWLRDRPGAPPRRIIFEKDKQIFGVLFSSDGKWLAINRENDVLFWDMNAGAVRSALAFKGPSWKSCMAFDPHNRLLACARGPNPELRFWDPAAGHEIPLAFPAKTCSAMAFSPDGSLLALAPQLEEIVSDTLFISVIDVSNARVYAEMRGHQQTVTALTFSPDSRLAPGEPRQDRRALGRLYSGSEDRTVRAWDLQTGREQRTFHGHTLGITSLSMHPSGKRLASGGEDNAIKVWDLEPTPPGISFNPLVKVLGEFLGHLQFTPDRRLQVLTMNGEVKGLRAWDAETGRWLEDHPLPVDSGAFRPYRAVSFDRDARRVAAVPMDDPRTVKVWDTAHGAELATAAGHAHRVAAVALSPDGRLLATAAMSDFKDNPRREPAEILLWEMNSGRQLRRLPTEAIFVSSLAFSPDGNRLAVALVRPAGDGQVHNAPAEIDVWDLTSDQIVTRLSGGAGLIPNIAFDPEGNLLAAAYYQEAAIRVFDLATGDQRFRRDLGSPATSVTFNPRDGRRLAGIGYDGLVRLWDSESGQIVLTLRGLGPPGSGHYNFTPRVAFSPDGRRLAANDWDGTVTVWDAGQKLTASLPRHP